MQKNCVHCRQGFEIVDTDLSFYEKVSPVIGGMKYLIPPPTLCPDCRQQRRLAWRNERKLYHRKCDKTGKQIISIYSADKPIPVYANDVWWSDDWDPLAFGMDIDFSKPFFAQFVALQSKVPRVALFGKGNENSDYTNHADHLKNCYMALNAGLSESVYFSNWIVKCKDCTDCSYATDCELGYELLHCERCYRSSSLINCSDCSDSAFLYDCRGCRSCLMCTGLRNKEYHVRNKPVSKEEFQHAMQELRSYSLRRHAEDFFRREFLLGVPHRATFMVNADSCTGDQLSQSANLRDCYFVSDSQDCAYCYDSIGLKDCHDCYETGFGCELDYDVHACNRSTRALFSTASYDNHDIVYCDLCHNSRNLFGCIGLRRKQYCILNKQYTKEEYEQLVLRILELMPHSNEFGEFFPVTMSPFCYNETMAQEYYPLSAEQVVEQQWRWRQEESTGEQYLGPQVTIPDSIEDITDDIADAILVCDVTGKPYKIIPQELKFYREMGLPVPRRCPDQRHTERISLRNPRRLWKRQCAKCKISIETTYAPDRPEIVYCEGCYLSAIY